MQKECSDSTPGLHWLCSCRAFGLCYRCKKPGHIARDCRSRELKHVVRGLSDDQFAELVEIRRVASQSRASTSAVESSTSAPPATEQGFVSPQ